MRAYGRPRSRKDRSACEFGRGTAVASPTKTFGALISANERQLGAYYKMLFSLAMLEQWLRGVRADRKLLPSVRLSDGGLNLASWVLAVQQSHGEVAERSKAAACKGRYTANAVSEVRILPLSATPKPVRVSPCDGPG